MLYVKPTAQNSRNKLIYVITLHNKLFPKTKNSKNRTNCRARRHRCSCLSTQLYCPHLLGILSV